MHWSCENLTKEVFEAHIANPDSEYICLLCKHDNLSENADDITVRAPKVDDSTHEGPSGPGINSQALSSGLDVAGPLHSSGDTAHTPESPALRHHSDETLVKVPFATSTVEVLPDSIISVQHGTSQKQPLVNRGELPPRSASSVQSRPNGEHPAADVCPSAETNAQTISTMSAEGLASRLDDLKAKEKNLASKDRRIRELQKKLNVKEINLGDTVDSVEYSKAFISQVEKK